MNLEDVLLLCAVGAAVGWIARGEWEDYSANAFNRKLWRRDK